MVSTALRFPGAETVAVVRELVPATSRSSRRRGWVPGVLLLAAAAIFVLLIRAHGEEFVRSIDRALHASWKLVLLAVLLEAGSVAGYVLLLHRVVARASWKLRLKDSYDITLAGAAATRLLPTAGLGGAAVTVWALRARGVRTSELSERLLAFLLLLYGVYMAALLSAGAAVASGAVPVTSGRDLGALGGALAVAVAGAVLLLLAAPAPVAAALGRLARRRGRLGRAAVGATGQLPVLRGGLRRAWVELRRPHAALLGAAAWWALDVGVLLVMLRAFGAALPIPVVVLAYFLGTMFNVVPLPGSLSGGLVATLIALGCPVGAAIAAVLAYRALAVWLPTLPGIVSLGSLRASVAVWRAEPAAAFSELNLDEAELEELHGLLEHDEIELVEDLDRALAPANLDHEPDTRARHGSRSAPDLKPRYHGRFASLFLKDIARGPPLTAKALAYGPRSALCPHRNSASPASQQQHSAPWSPRRERSQPSAHGRTKLLQLLRTSQHLVRLRSFT